MKIITHLDYSLDLTVSVCLLNALKQKAREDKMYLEWTFALQVYFTSVFLITKHTRRAYFTKYIPKPVDSQNEVPNSMIAISVPNEARQLYLCDQTRMHAHTHTR